MTPPLTLAAVRALGVERGRVSDTNEPAACDWRALHERFGRAQTVEAGRVRADVATEFRRGFDEGRGVCRS